MKEAIIQKQKLLVQLFNIPIKVLYADVKDGLKILFISLK